jgi:YidC/Oxa1 family membrane protein insertase
VNTIVQGMTSILELLFKFSSMIGLPYYGVAIIIFTVIIKVLLYPLTWKQMVSMRRITELQPKMQELQKKYGKNKEKLNQKMMELYTKEKVNPYAGCLPILVQLPILWAFYQTLFRFPYSNDSTIWFLGFDITKAYGFSLDYHLLLPIIAAATTYIMTKVSTATNPSMNAAKDAKPGTPQATAQQTQKFMFVVMPFFMAYIVATLPSGLGIYIITMNVVSMLQTVYINKKLAAEKQKAEAA